MTESTSAHSPIGQWMLPQEMSADMKIEIHELAHVCNQYEGISLKLHISMLENRKPGERRDFLWRDSEGTLVGYLGLNSFETDSAEVVAMVHPDQRRQGIMTELFKTAKVEAAAQGMSKLILICPENSASGQAYINSLEIQRSFSEYVMKWSESDDLGKQADKSGISLRFCGATERELIITLDMGGYDMPREDAELYVDQVLENSPEDRIYAAFQEDGQPIGKICIQLKEGAAFIFGFSVLPEWRGQGFGRNILRESIQLVRSEGCTSIRLEVECENRNALGLYHSCGFRETAVQDYFNYGIS
ncbi:GNAT family N-acetyltransferase [Gorillibacterium timonense]|uniref:GNAT family N-acetyltransferase n=1 Tax=Gorillibacterium timonense TaxID=1689269 RepID=UPI00071D939E|nr:GNAT family N-acetyltransferase [Gorillibacterium timonense]